MLERSEGKIDDLIAARDIEQKVTGLLVSASVACTNQIANFAFSFRMSTTVSFCVSVTVVSTAQRE